MAASRAEPGEPFDAVMLAGGRARRAGGLDKPAARVGGRTLAGSVVSAAVAAGAARVVVVGPERPGLLAGIPRPPRGILFVREQPPGSGPVPAALRGLAEVDAALVTLLAADLPFLRRRHLLALLAAARRGGRGAVLLDGGGRAQWLASCWRTQALREAARQYEGASLHALLRPLTPVEVTCDLAPGEPPPWLDCDTAEDLARAREWRERTGPGPGRWPGQAGEGQAEGGRAGEHACRVD